MRDLICALAFHARDADAALLWCEWTAHLSRTCPVDAERLVIVPSRNVPPEVVQRIADICRATPTYFAVTIRRPHDEDEAGYPGSASHMFCRTLEICADEHPGKAVLFCEPDTVALRASWFHELKQDYRSRTRRFVGLFVKSTQQAVEEFGFPTYHMTGNAIYPANALDLAPSIRTCLTAPRNLSPWGDKGQSFDLFCAHEIMPEAEETPLIQQIWKSDPWNADNLSRLNPRAALFHQSKDASLLFCLAERHHPDFLAKLPPPARRFSLVTSKPTVTIGRQTFRFTPCARDPGGRLHSVYAPKNRREELALVANCGSLGLSEITPEEFAALLVQSLKFRA